MTMAQVAGTLSGRTLQLFASPELRCSTGLAAAVQYPGERENQLPRLRDDRAGDAARTIHSPVSARPVSAEKVKAVALSNERFGLW